MCATLRNNQREGACLSLSLPPSCCLEKGSDGLSWSTHIGSQTVRHILKIVGQQASRRPWVSNGHRPGLFTPGLPL